MADRVLREDRQMTQKELILSTLRNYREGVCGNYFLEAHIPRYAARINELRNDGHTIDSIRCPHPYHTHRANIATYQLTTEPARPPTSPNTEYAWHGGEAWIRRTHTAPDRLVR